MITFIPLVGGTREARVWRFLDAILAGEREPQILAKLRDWRIKASEDTIMNSLVGDDREEHLFVLRQSMAIEGIRR